MNAQNKITYQAFTERVAKRADVSDVEADAFIHQFSRTAGDALEEGGEVQLYRFGRFQTTHVDERPGHNPGTGEAVTTPEHTRVEFQPYKALLLAVNWPFRHLRTRMLPEEEKGTRTSAVTWLILALALLALLMVGLDENTGIFDGNSVAATPASVTAPPATVSAPPEQAPAVEPQQPVIQAAPLPVATAADTATATPIESIEATNVVVAAGDTLSAISVSHWGDASWWPVIYAENRPDLPNRNPDLITTGSSVRIPELAGSVDQPTDADLRQKANSYRIVADDYAELGNARAAGYRLLANRRVTAL